MRAIRMVCGLDTLKPYRPQLLKTGAYVVWRPLEGAWSWRPRAKTYLKGREKKFACFAKQQPGRARQNFLVTTYTPYFSALYVSNYPSNE